jgi:hypothetical protein
MQSASSLKPLYEELDLFGSNSEKEIESSFTKSKFSPQSKDIVILRNQEHGHQ